ncbi:hypothetical protein Emag_000813 [Eimeria magna]
MREPAPRVLLLLPVLVLAFTAPCPLSTARCLILSKCTFVRGALWLSFFPAAAGPRGSSRLERLAWSTRCLAQEVPRAPKAKAAGSLVGHKSPSPSFSRVFPSGSLSAGGPTCISQGPVCSTRESSPVIGLPVPTAIVKSNTTGSSSSVCSRNQQLHRLSTDAYHRLSPSFLGSLLLTLHPNGPSRQPRRLKQRLADENISADAKISRSTSELHQQSGTAGEILVYPRSFEEPDVDACGADDYDQQTDALGKGAHLTLREDLLEVRLQQLLEEQLLPEIALAGRSNVGKSALLNSFFRLCSSNASTSKLPHARSSRTPGRTQAIDLYLFCFAAATRRRQAQQHHQQQQQFVAQRGALVVADLPGYGFTKGISPERARRISRTLEVYIQRKQVQQQQLNRVLLLIDGRRGIGHHDAALLGLLAKLKVQTTLVVTKEDKVDAQQMMDLVHCLSDYKQLLLPPDLLQVRMQLLRQQHQREGNIPSENTSNGARSSSPVSPLLRDPFLSVATAESLLQPPQEMERQMAKQRVPVFVVSARTGTGVKQLWQHVLESAARFSKERFVSAASAPPRNAAKQNSNGTEIRKAVPLRIQPAALPDEFF